MQPSLPRPRPRGFAAALQGDELRVIAEIKRRSPSKGDLTPDLDPALLAKAYAAGGAAACRCSPTPTTSAAAPPICGSARTQSTLPVLRKDFTVCERDVPTPRARWAPTPCC